MSPQLKSGPEIRGIHKTISQLVLGTAAYQMSRKDHWFEMLDAFLAYGGTVVDTARMYAGGEGEQIIGSWMASRGVRDRVVVITKSGHGPADKLPVENLAQSLSEELTASLETLGIDRVDLLLLHRDNREIAVGEIIDYLNSELASGRVSAFGVSNWEYDRVREACEYAERHGLACPAAVSNNLSLAAPTGPFYPGLVSVDAQGERWHAHTGTPLISWSAQARGFFTGRWTRQMRENADACTDGFTRRMLQYYCTDENFAKLRRAQELGARKGGRTAVQMALAWLLNKPLPVLPIVGPLDAGQLASCVEAAEIDLSPDEFQWLSGTDAQSSEHEDLSD